MIEHTDLKAMAARLKKARIAAGYPSAASCARAVGLSHASYGEYERGGGKPSAETLSRICSVLKISPDWLLFGKTAEVENDKPNSLGKNIGGCVTQERTVTEKQKTVFPQNLQELIDAIDDMDPALPGYLVEGKALRSALHGDPNGDAAPAYLAMLCSKPAVVNYYRDRTHMRKLNTAGTISDVEYRDWFVGRRELLRLTPMNPPAACVETEQTCGVKQVLKCTAENVEI